MTTDYLKSYYGSHDTIDAYFWSNVNATTSYNETGAYNVWSYSALNTINLNTNYLNYFDEKWQNLIATSTWYVGYVNRESIFNLESFANPIRYNASIVFDYEQGNNKIVASPRDPYEAKVGLMYTTDYLYAAVPEYWGESAYGLDYYHGLLEKNWMFIGFPTWTLIPSSSSTNAYTIDINAYTLETRVVNKYRYGIRPTFYLNHDVGLNGGDGTKDNPYRISA